MQKAWKEFKDFALSGNMVNLAIAFVLGSAFSVVVQSLAKDVIGDLIGALGGAPDLSGLVIPVRRGSIHIGNFIGVLIGFLINSVALFGLVKLLTKFNLATIETKPVMKPCPRCCQTVPAAATRCGHCTSELRVDDQVIADELDSDLANQRFAEWAPPSRESAVMFGMFAKARESDRQD